MRNTILIILLIIAQLTRAQDNTPPIINDTLIINNYEYKPSWDFKFSGFIQADAIIDNKELSYIDGFLPTHLKSNQIDYNSYFTMRQSQLGLEITQKDIDIKGYIEIDFIGPDNKTQPRLRKLYFTYKNWKIGQDWSNLNDLDTWPNLLDFNGPNAALYARRMQIRYTKQLNDKNLLSFSLEDPNIASITLPENNLEWKQNNHIPSFTAAYKYGSKSYIRGAAIVTPISYKSRINLEDNPKNQTTIGLGLHTTSVIYTNKLSNFKLVAAIGNGTATNVISFGDEGYDAIPNPYNPKSLKKLNYFSTVAAYEHWWNEKWSSVIFYSGSFIGDKKYSSKGMFKSIQQIGINTVYQPTKYFRTGFDLTYGFVDRYQVSNKSEAARLQLSAAFSF